MRSNQRFVAAGMLAALALAACGSSSKTAGTATPTSAPPTSSAPTSPTPTSSATIPTVSIGTTTLGKTLVDSKGLTLYVSDKDTTAGVSSCVDACATAWPPLTVTGTPTYGSGVTASMFTTINRTDGSKQLAVNGKPLYRWVNDAKVKDVTGQGVNGFYAAGADGKKIDKS